MTKRPRIVEAVATAVLAAAAIGLIWIVPDNPLAHLSEPAYFAIAACVVVIGGLAVLRPLGPRGYRYERLLLTVFLLGMPIIYIASVLLHSAGAPWLALEVAGLALFGAVAVGGRLRSFRWVAAGIAAHGVWDLAHYGQTDYIADWYTIACAVIDTSLGFYVWSRLSRRDYARGYRDDSVVSSAIDAKRPG